MEKPSSVPLVILLVVLFAASPAIAEMVEHHGNTVKIEETAESCIACHDGSIAGNTVFCTVKCNFTTPHSIKKRYPPPIRKASYAPVAVVKAKGVRIVNGMVTCISCHNLKNRGKDHLVLDEKGRLCAICHISE